MLDHSNVLRLFPGMLIAYQGFSCFITNDFGAVADGKAGFFYRQTRFLSRLKVKVNGSTPSCASGNTVDANSMIFYYLAPSPAGRRAGPDPDNPADDGGEMVRQGIELQVNAFVEGGLHLEFVLTNHTLADAPIELSWELAADYADHLEVQSGEHCQGAPVEQDWASDDQGGVLSFRYAHLHLDHATRVRFSGAGAGFGYRDGLVRHMTVLKSHTPVRLSVDVIPVFCGHAVPPAYGGDAFRARATEQDEARARWAEAATRLSTPVAMVQRAWDRAVCDLGSLFLLEGSGPERYTPAAGLPEYQALFGRDSLMTACQCGLLGPDMLRGTLLTLRRWNATAYDDRYDEQPGKIVHQHQRSPLALLGKTPFRHYYGDYTAPALFLIDLASDFAWTGDVGLIRSTDEEITRTLTWMDRDGDLDGDGLYEYQTRAGNWGIKNQGWKDSAQAILYPDGRTVPDPIALIEIQGAYYAAKRLMGLAYRAIGEAARGTALLEQAAALKRRVNERFWLPDEQYVALALDPDKKPVRTIACDPGQALIYGVLDRDKAQAVARRLLAPDLFSGWGVRTLSSGHPAYNPLSYHLGSVWPLANAMIAAGLKLYGFIPELHALAKGLFEATGLFDLGRLPETFGGHPRDRQHPHPGIYPKACAPQAWSAGAVVQMIQALLGLVPLAPFDLLAVDPDLPEWLPEVTIEGLRVGDSTVSLAFQRDASGLTDYRILAAQGPVRVERQTLARFGGVA